MEAHYLSERTDAADLIYGALLDIIGLEIPLPNRK